MEKLARQRGDYGGSTHWLMDLVHRTGALAALAINLDEIDITIVVFSHLVDSIFWRAKR